MPLKQYKICMLGSFSVGKTSLVKRFVESIFSEKYLTTIGVKVDKKTVQLNNEQVKLMLWDIEGEDSFYKLKSSYLRGASGYFLVVDGTRQASLEVALKIYADISNEFGNLPHLLVINKMDLVEDWNVDMQQIEKLKQQGWQVIHTSAKTGEHVEEIFLELTRKMLPM